MQAIVFVTHIESEAIYKHYMRLMAETQGILDVFLCIHEPTKRHDNVIIPADFRVSLFDEKNKLPTRHAEKMRRAGTIVPGFTDLAYMPALFDQRFSDYTHFWVMEYDVDFAGPWGSFFRSLMSSQADLFGTTFYPKDQCPGWHHWTWFEAPSEVSSKNHVRSFLPIVRFSRRMIDCYVRAVQSGAWQGHTEALYPTIACHHGLTIEDLGGNGPFTPPLLRGRNYFNSPSPDGDLIPGSFIYRPVEHTAYFHIAPEQFPEQGYLYHPVKVHDESGPI